MACCHWARYCWVWPCRPGAVGLWARSCGPGAVGSGAVGPTLLSPVLQARSGPSVVVLGTIGPVPAGPAPRAWLYWVRCRRPSAVGPLVPLGLWAQCCWAWHHWPSTIGPVLQMQPLAPLLPQAQQHAAMVGAACPISARGPRLVRQITAPPPLPPPRNAVGSLPLLTPPSPRPHDGSECLGWTSPQRDGDAGPTLCSVLAYAKTRADV